LRNRLADIKQTEVPIVSQQCEEGTQRLSIIIAG
jgi:hypothetical protein